MNPSDLKELMAKAKQAQAKMAELEERIAEAERMKRVLRAVMRCQCPTLADCSRAMKASGGQR